LRPQPEPGDSEMKPEKLLLILMGAGVR